MQIVVFTVPSGAQFEGVRTAHDCDLNWSYIEYKSGSLQMAAWIPDTDLINA